MNRSNTNVAGQLLGEYAALEYILLGDLRDLLEEPADKETCRWLLAVLDALLDTLPREMELQEQGGYMEDVLEQYPNWSDQVDHLQHEKRALYTKLRQLRDGISRERRYSKIAEEVRTGLRDWMSSLVAHHRHERRILQTAFNLDVGTGD